MVVEKSTLEKIEELDDKGCFTTILKKPILKFKTYVSHICMVITKHPVFGAASLLLIIVNSVVMAIEDT